MIGPVDALVLQSKARPIPESSLTDKVNGHLDSIRVNAIAKGVAPNATALEKVSKQLAKMKSVDCSIGSTAGAVAIFKNAVIISMNQAITYGSFLDPLKTMINKKNIILIVLLLLSIGLGTMEVVMNNAYIYGAT